MVLALRQISRAVDLHSRELLQRIGLTAPQVAALKALSRLQPVTIGGLARAIHLSQATLTGIVRRLENRGLATRTRSGTDRRSVVVELTAEGKRVVESAPSLLHERFHREFEKLEDWEQTLVLSTLQRVAAMMHADDLERDSEFSTGNAGESPETAAEPARFLNGGGEDAATEEM